MSTHLHTAKVYQIDYSEIIHHGYDCHEVFRNIFMDAGIRPDDIIEEYAFLVERKAMDELRERLQKSDNRETEEYKRIGKFLEELNMSVSDFCKVLERLSTESDPNNDMVLLEWW